MDESSNAAGASSDTSASRSSGEMASQIATVAARLFAERGFDATSVREIVEAAGVTKPTLYYHFGSKRGLVEALLTEPLNGFLASFRDRIDREADPIRLLRELFAVQIAFMAEEPDRARFMYALCFGPQNSSLRGELSQLADAMAEVTRGCVGRLAESGVIARERAAACEQAIRGLIMSSTMDSLMHGLPLEANLADRLVVDLLAGFGARGFRFDEGRESER